MTSMEGDRYGRIVVIQRNGRECVCVCGRFTGSQVYRDAAGVAGEAIGFASGLAWREAD